MYDLQAPLYLLRKLAMINGINVHLLVHCFVVGFMPDVTLHMESFEGEKFYFFQFYEKRRSFYMKSLYKRRRYT